MFCSRYNQTFLLLGRARAVFSKCFPSVVPVPIHGMSFAAKHAKLLDSLKHLKVATDASPDSDEEDDQGSDTGPLDFDSNIF